MSLDETLRRDAVRTRDGVAMRRALVQAVSAAAGGGMALLLRLCLPSRPGCSWTDVQCSGKLDLADVEALGAALRQHGARVLRAALTTDAAEREPLANPPPLSARRAATWRRALDRTLGRSRVRVIIGRDALLGMLYVSAETPDAASRVADLLRSAPGSLERVLVEAHHQDAGRRIQLLCDDTGRILFAGRGAARWTTNPLRLTRTALWIRTCRAHPDAALPGLGGLAPTVHPMTRPGGRARRWLVQLRPAPLSGRTGRHLLTDRQIQVAELAAEGLRNHEIAARLGLSAGTVKVHLRHAYRTLRIGSRAELRAALGTGCPHRHFSTKNQPSTKEMN